MSPTSQPLPLEPLAALVQLRIDELRDEAGHHTLTRAARRPGYLTRALHEAAERLTELLRPRPQACATC